MALVAAGALAFGRWSAGRDEAALWLADAPTRGVEPRLSSGSTSRYRPLAGSRDEGAGVLPAPPLTVLARMEQEGQLVAIADAYLLRGQAEPARPYLDRAPPGADALATRAALDLLAGKPEDAVHHAGDALRLQRSHAAARWNLALALRDLGLPFAAAQELDAVAHLGEPGWSDEARALASRLRDDTRHRVATYQDGLRRCRAAMRGEAPYPLDVADHSKRLARSCFHDVLRAAGTVEEVARLEPVAAALDARFGGEALARDVASVKVAASAAQRPELSRTYASAVEAWPGADVLVELANAARAAGQPDIELGALSFIPSGRRDLARYRTLALATGDPWFATLAEEQAADADQHQGQPARALERLRPLEERCASSDRVEDRCLTVERTIARAYVEVLQTRQAKEAALRALEIARAEGDWAAELRSLKEVGQLERLRGDLWLTHAYLEEALARAPGNCETAELVRSSLAAAHLEALEPAEARRQIDLLSGCDNPPSLDRMFVLADLQRSLPGKNDETALRRGLASARDDLMLGPGDQALITHLRGRAVIERDRGQGDRLLSLAISESEQLAGTDRSARKARRSSYTSLLMVAGKRGDYSAALRLFAAEGHWPETPSCSIWLAADAERLLVVSVDPDRGVLGHYDGARRKPVTADHELVPPEVLDSVRGCPAVKVIARPPLEGRPDLLPPDMAWSEVLQGEPTPPAPASTGPHVVVSSPEPPPWLRLPPIRSAPPPVPASGQFRLEVQSAIPTRALEAAQTASLVEVHAHGMLRLDARSATPTRVLEAMRTASLVEMYAHGLVAPDAADASFLALSPEASGDFALSAADVRKEQLAGHPLVLLASCHAGEATTFLDEGHGLPRAFLEAGARGVLMVGAPIPERESETFFRPLLERIQSGELAATALRDARVEWHRDHGASWVDSVVAFE